MIIKNIIKELGFIFIISVLFTSAAQATTWSVCSSGCDYTSIQSAINGATIGDTIEVQSGTYKENIVVDKQLTIRSENGYEHTTIDGGGSGNTVNITADNVTIEGFTITGGGDYANAGLRIGSSGNTINSNNISNNNDDGIDLDSSRSNTITSNNISNNADGIELGSSSNYNTITSNNISNNNDDGIDLDSSSNNTITSNNIFNNNYEGIELGSSSNYNIITSNNISNNADGIELGSSSNYNTITSNNISNNNDDGIDLDSSSNNTITSNNIFNNNYEGIELGSSSNNTITSNNIFNNNYDGIGLRRSSNNTITSNNIYSNDDEGIYLDSSNNNKIYLNNFINNTDNVDSSDSTNIWNSTITYTYKGKTYTNYLGNYWSDYTGSDSDNDGIGDSPYNINSDRDTVPLIKHFENYTIVLYYIYINYSPMDPQVRDEITFEAFASPNSDVEIQSYMWCFGDGEHAEGKKVNHSYSVGGYYTVNLTVMTNKGNGTVKVNLTVFPIPVQVIAEVGSGKVLSLGPGENPQLLDGKAVWEVDDGIDREIAFYDGVKTIMLSNNKIHDALPELDEEGILWLHGETVEEKRCGSYCSYNCRMRFVDQAHVILWRNKTMVRFSDPLFSYSWGDFDLYSEGWHNHYDPLGNIVSCTITYYYGSPYPKHGHIIGNGRVVWVGKPLLLSNKTIFLYNGQNVTNLTDITSNSRNPQVDKTGLVAWEGYDGNDWEIFVWNGSTIRSLTTNDYNDELLQVDDSMVLFQHYDGQDSEGFLYDGEEVIQLTNNQWDDFNFVMDNGQVVWQGYDGNDYEIHLYNGEKAIQLTDNQYDDILPRIHNGQAAWKGFDGNDYEVFFYNGKDVIQLTDNNVDDRGPRIYDGQLTWRSFDGNDYEILFYDGKEIIQLTDDDCNELPPEIDKSYVLWQDEFYNIYVYTALSLTSTFTTTPPTVDGTINTGEWGDAVSITLNGFNNPQNTKGGQLYIMNDNNNLYAAVIVPDTAQDADYLMLDFDQNNDNIATDGNEDAVGFNVSNLYHTLPRGYADFYWYGTWWNSDTTPHGSGAMSYSKGNYTYEFSKPLSSGDTQDMGVSTGDTIGFRIETWDGTISDWYRYPQNTVDADTTRWGEWADLKLAKAPLNQKPIANFKYSQDKLIVNETIVFNASYSYDPDGYITSYEWNFGDWNTTNTIEEIITHSYSSAGSYNVTLTVTDDEGARNSTSKVITIQAVSDTTPPSSISNLQLTSGQTWINWTWTDPIDIDFSKVMVYLDGSFRTNVSKGIQFYNATNLEPDTLHTISTRTVDTSGNFNQTWVNNTVRTAPIITPNQKPKANFTYSPENPVVNQTITFNASLSYDIDGNITEYKWDFGDNTTGTGVAPTHVYTASGTYTVTLTVTDNDNATNSITYLLNIKTIKGDFNGNGKVDIGDATYVAYMVVGKVPVNRDADFNGNGRVDIGDAAKIAYYVVGKVDSL